MNKLVFLAILAMLTLTSCLNLNEGGESYEYDWNYIRIPIYVQDKQGNDLLKDGTIDHQKITITSRNEKPFKVYGIKEFKTITQKLNGPQRNEVTPLRALPPAVNYGAGIIEDNDGRYALIIGDYNGGSTYDKESILIDWGDGTQDHIEFSRKFSGSRPYIKAEDQIFLNGKLLSSSELPIIIRK